MNAKLIGGATQRFIRAFQDVHRILLELGKAQWYEPFSDVLKQAAKESRVAAALASELADLHSLRKRTFNIWGTRSAIPSPAALARLERILEGLRRARRRAMAGKPTTDDPLSQGLAQKESARRGISGIAAVVRVLANRNNREISIEELTAEAMKAGWSPNGTSPKQTLSNALHSEIRRRGRLARFAKGRRPGSWKLSMAGVHYANEQICMALLNGEPDRGMQMAFLMTADEYTVVDEDDLEL